MIDNIIPDVFDIRHSRARKQHTCCECDGIIRPGELYYYRRGLWDGTWDTFRTCHDCEALRDKIHTTIQRHDDWPPFGGLFDYIEGL
jgi:hypothetical protein